MNFINSKLYSHQINHVNKIKNIIGTNLRVLDVSETGTGKTYTSIAACKLLKLKPLVICPKSIINHWIDVMKYFGLDFYGISNFESFIHEWYYDEYNDRVKCPYIVKTDTGYTWKHIPKDFILIVDEAHKCKKSNTYKWKVLKAAADIEHIRILLLSATIADKPEYFAITGYTLNLYNNIIESKKWLSGMKNDINYMKQIHHIIFPNYAVKMCMKDISQTLPKHEVEVKWFDMAKHSVIINEQYKIIKSEIINLKKKTNKGDALAKITFSRQIIEIEKLFTLINLTKKFVSDGFAVAIFVNFTKTLKELSNALNTNCIVYGKQSNTIRQNNINDFNTDKSQIIILNIKVGGESISLHDKLGKYPRISLISPSFSAQDIIQTLGRCYRVGSKTPVKQIIVCCDCPTEKNLFNILETKIQNISFLNNGKIINCLTDTISESSNSFSKSQYENLFDILDSLPITDTFENINNIKNEINEWFNKNKCDVFHFFALYNDRLTVSITYLNNVHLIKIVYPELYPKIKKGFSCTEIFNKNIRPFKFIPIIDTQLINKSISIGSILTHLLNTFNKIIIKSINSSQVKSTIQTNTLNELDSENNIDQHCDLIPQEVILSDDDDESEQIILSDDDESEQMNTSKQQNNHIRSDNPLNEDLLSSEQCLSETEKIQNDNVLEQINISKNQNNQMFQLNKPNNNYFAKNYSQKAIDWLNFLMQIKKIYISHAENGNEFQIPETSYRADGYCKETNTIYEFYGCYWHGCPICYKTYSNKYQQLIIRENKIMNLGYNLIFIWECTWDTIILSSENHKNCVKIVEV
jgi:superfamily II DNA or RNA helicase